MVAHGGESPTRKPNARRHVVHAAVLRNQKNKSKMKKILFILVALQAVFQSCSSDDCIKRSKLVGNWYQEMTEAEREKEQKKSVEGLKMGAFYTNLTLNEDGTYTYVNTLEIIIDAPSENLINEPIVTKTTGSGKWKLDCKYLLYENDNNNKEEIVSVSEKIKKKKDLYKGILDAMKKGDEPTDKKIEHQQILEFSNSLFKTDTKIYKRM
jgi:hypothetical protein